jgi:hypothetical protein
MMGVMLTPETVELEERKGFDIKLPKFFWTILERRAEAKKKDLQAALNDLVAEVMLVWLGDAIKAAIPVPVN